MLADNRLLNFVKSLLNPEELGMAVPAHVRDEARAILGRDTVENDAKGNDWIQTYTGQKLFPLNPKFEDIKIEDIAHSLSLKCRFGGHSICHYGVSQHSVLVSENVPEQYALCALMHDSSEYALCDLASPIKCHFPNFARAELKLMKVIAKKFGFVWPEPLCVKRADRILLNTERRDLMFNPGNESWGLENYPPLKKAIIPWTWQEAEERFLDRFHEVKNW